MHDGRLQEKWTLAQMVSEGDMTTYNRVPQYSVDPELFELIDAELEAQDSYLNLTAAANYLSAGVRCAMDPRLSNVHVEGYPGKRFHAGSEQADAIETLAAQRAKTLFGADHANVQPYRGTLANLAATMAVLKPGEKLLALDCRSGGHYTTSTRVHCIGRLFDVRTYSVDPTTERIDYDSIARLTTEHGPRLIFCGDTAYPRTWDYRAMRKIAQSVDAVLAADISQTAGLIAGGYNPNPLEHVDLATAATYKTLRGPRAGLILSSEKFAAAVDRAVSPVCQGGPDLMLLAGLAAALAEAASPSFQTYCAQTVGNARMLARELQAQQFRLVAGGTDNHACLVDLRHTSITGEWAATQLAKAGILCNGNQVPFDPGPPHQPDGLRLGVSAITTLGAGADDMVRIGRLIGRAFEHLDDDAELARVRREVLRLREHLHFKRSQDLGAEPPMGINNVATPEVD
jgi:glycine hydroxymethyltransferase